MNNVTIDLSKCGGPVFTGRDKGETIRSQYNLDSIDKDAEADVSIIVPENTFSLNSSFFLGMFGNSIRAAGTRENFLKKFKFKYPPHINQFIESGIERALLDKSSLLS